MADNILKLLLESKSTLEVLGNLLQSALNTVVVAKSTGQEFKSIFDNVSGSGVLVIDPTHAKLGGKNYTLKQLQHALVIVLVVASSGLIGYAAYNNPNHFEVIQQNLSQIKTNVNEKIRRFVNRLNIREVINLLGQSLTGLISQSTVIFDALWKRVANKIGNVVKKWSNLRDSLQSNKDDEQYISEDITGPSTKFAPRLQPQPSPLSSSDHEIFMNPQFSSPNRTVSRKKVESPRTSVRRSIRRSPRTRSRQSIETMITPKRSEIRGEDELP